MFARHREAIEKARPSVPYEPYSVGVYVCWKGPASGKERYYGRVSHRPTPSFPYYMCTEDDTNTTFLVREESFIGIG